MTDIIKYKQELIKEILKIKGTYGGIYINFLQHMSILDLELKKQNVLRKGF